ncbi:MAG: inorganic phosphate transporter, partial [Candidatus Thiodiazotropha sp.]
ELDRSDSRLKLSKKERGSLQKLYSYEFVKRTTFLRILMAWVVTLPVSAVLASLIFVLLD